MMIWLSHIYIYMHLQSLFEFEDCVAKSPKATAASDRYGAVNPIILENDGLH